ncbi:SMI1/KNR4 family protein [Stieleria sp. JC731]|uniref:SMI1/KNR4 family protein n=1 Tax=Pirellulaceae TaxID=2691357 RepID=UPI001E4797F7|nr:SMI1/KNR4 family protein [Stieleria sp. JC731]MCC9602254.1 SMI1/KNR4 family protein [Stieleria sp. JC731]
MWKELIANLTDEAEFASPATPDSISSVETLLGVRLPEDLSALLAESNGVVGEYGVDRIWNTERIERENNELRTEGDYKSLYMPFDHLLFFADAGNGDLFGYAILDGEIRKDDIYAWDHEDDSRKWVAGSLRGYIQTWLDGSLEI